MKFELKATDLQSKARAGIINTDHGIIETPIFMPVGTSATIILLIFPLTFNRLLKFFFC